MTTTITTTIQQQQQQKQKQQKQPKQQLSNDLSFCLLFFLFFCSFFALYLSYDWVVGTIFSQLVFPPKNGHKNGHFSKPHFLQKKSGLRPFSNTICVKKYIFLGFSKFAISEEYILS